MNMIDCHCHLEAEIYAKEIEKFIKKLKSQLKFVISSVAATDELERALELYNKFSPFMQLCVGLHPIYIKQLREKHILKTMDFIKEHKDKIVGIGEIGLDYNHVKEKEWQEKEKELFVRFLRLAKELDKPVVIHCWKAEEDTISILEQEGFSRRKVLLHLFQGKEFINRVIKNNWLISIGPSIARSKDIKKIARDIPLNNLLLETDSPWFAQEGQKYGTPLNVKVACEKIAEIKKISISEVEKQTDLNAISFFNLKIK